MTSDIKTIGLAIRSGPRHGWAVVAGQELRDLWFGIRGLTLILGYSLILSVLTLLIAGNAELNLLDARESIGLFVQVTLGLGTLAALIISADAISGERERGTLEHLLLTSVRRRDFVVGKLLSALTVWVSAFAISVPYIFFLARGPGIVGDAVLVLMAGTLVAVALTSLGLAVSSVSQTNRASLIIAIVILLALAAPSQLPASATRGVLGDILILANPVAAGLKLTSEVIVNQATWATQWTLLIAPVVASVIFTSIALVSSRKVGL